MIFYIFDYPGDGRALCPRPAAGRQSAHRTRSHLATGHKVTSAPPVYFPRVSLWEYTGAGENDFSARGAARARHAEDADAPGDLVLGDQACEPPRLGLGFGRIVVSEIEVPNMLANLL